MKNYVKTIVTLPTLNDYAPFDPSRKPLAQRTRLHFFDDENEADTAKALAVACDARDYTSPRLSVSVFSRPHSAGWTFVPEVAEWGSAMCAAA